MNVDLPHIEMSPRTRRFMRELADEGWEDSLTRCGIDAPTKSASGGDILGTLRAAAQGSMAPERVG